MSQQQFLSREDKQAILDWGSLFIIIAVAIVGIGATLGLAAGVAVFVFELVA